jgi:hypothetical protein
MSGQKKQIQKSDEMTAVKKRSLMTSLGGGVDHFTDLTIQNSPTLMEIRLCIFLE